MRYLSTCFVCLLVHFFCAPSGYAEIITFEDKSLSPNSFYNGNTGAPNSDGWTSGSAKFNNNYDTTFGEYWDGWSYSNVKDKTTAGFGNQYAAFAGSGAGGGGNYAVTYQSFPQSYVDLPTGSVLQSAEITNTTYAAFSMLNGDAFSKKFGGLLGDDADFFKLTITGYAGQGLSGGVTGTKEFYLADYRFSNNSLDYVVSDWQVVDLSALGVAKSVGFSLSSSDNGNFGMNTPAYFAMDNLTFSAVPEPSSLVLFGIVGLVGIGFRRGRISKRVRESEGKSVEEYAAWAENAGG